MLIVILYGRDCNSRTRVVQGEVPLLLPHAPNLWNGRADYPKKGTAAPFSSTAPHAGYRFVHFVYTITGVVCRCLMCTCSLCVLTQLVELSIVIHCAVYYFTLVDSTMTMLLNCVLLFIHLSFFGFQTQLNVFWLIIYFWWETSWTACKTRIGHLKAHNVYYSNSQ